MALVANLHFSCTCPPGLHMPPSVALAPLDRTIDFSCKCPLQLHLPTRVAQPFSWCPLEKDFKRIFPWVAHYAQLHMPPSVALAPWVAQYTLVAHARFNCTCPPGLEEEKEEAKIRSRRRRRRRSRRRRRRRRRIRHSFDY